MLQTGILLKLWRHAIPGLTSVPVTQEIITPEEASLVFSGPQFLVALLSGVMMAFAFQLLLTNFSVAFGISTLGGDSVSDDDDESESLGSSIRKIEGKVGLWALITVSIALFCACFLAVKLTLVESTLLGAIIGVVIWSTYFSILVWVGSTAAGSLIGSVVSSATSGFQGLMGTATAALGANAAKAQVVSTAEEVTAAVRRELTSGFDPNSIKETLQSSLKTLELPKLDSNEIRSQFEKILQNSDLESLGSNDLLKNVDRQTLVDLVSSRTDFSKQELNQVVDQLESVWQKTFGSSAGNSQEELLNLLKSATPEQLKSDELSAKLEQLIGSDSNKDKSSGGLQNRMLQYGIEALMATVLGRADLSDLDIEKISGKLQKLTGKAKQTTKPFSAIKADIENYLLFSPPWELNKEAIKQQFRDVIYDPEASPGNVRQELEQLNRDYFVELLGLRDDFTAEGIQEVANYLEEIRQDVFSSVLGSEAKEQSENLRSRVENYLRSTGKEELNPESIQEDFKTLLSDPEAGVDALSNRLSQFDRDTFVQLLKERQDLSEDEANQIIGQLESTRDNVLSTARDLQEQAKSKADELRHRVEEYLRNTNKEELNPDGIKRDFKTLIDDPQAGLSALRSRLSQFDRDTLVQLLSQRQDLSEEQVNQVLDSIESTRDSVLQAPQKLAGKAKEQYEQTTNAIAEYLRNTNLSELDPEGIKQDLSRLLDDPKAGALALRERLSEVDRETLVKLLAGREDLSEEQVNRIIDEVQSSIRSIIKAPRRLATRAQKQVVDFEANLERYLRNTNKDELNPDGIKRDLQLLLNDPRAGMGNIGDRLAKFDRSTLVALLSQREDISEEEANRIADQIESVRNSVTQQLQQVQQRLQSAMDSIFGKIKDYLNSLERPELNYEGIKQDFSKLFDDPQAGFEALGDRLGQFDRDTLVALLSSREDISEADANRIIDQVEGARDNVLQQAERIQAETKKRISALKQKAKKQAVEAKKAAAGAAWWLFSTALTSLAVSAIAGALAVVGIVGVG
jgi:hypothetical protein